MAPSDLPDDAWRAGAPARPVLALRGVSKSFGAVRALVGVDLEVHAHEVLAIVGDNGAGKSTLVEILSGAQVPDAGHVEVDGEEVTFTSPGAARAQGIATVFQELALCENLDVVENLFLGNELERGPLLDEVTMERRAWEVLGQLAVRVPSVRVPVGALSGGQRQAVAVARSLLGEPRVVILDEPTAALGVMQTAEVLNLVERLRERGLAVILISQSLADVHAVADRIAVLRLGRTNGLFSASTTTYEDLFAAVTGVRTGHHRPADGDPPTASHDASGGWAR
ncbi:monosaccharide ABC transporter ATP-binding protein, CUT2 family [Sanguibacter gelidistatuariae]|uniref:Monosaccharide ABC transporter ATP-binding protein, CUT2 family n=1 Tax=Sanguibacter gelidistatuariae TaxID=1814289 RepID=A0A1G6KWH2_9MICO|nr:ATP-binding cassette domain-containing protein [Sanguibacter gelidistatuariae]SDC35430.1 monosaccharide ABC transporter ATP-binding protein, CUT2 family [Sanguibacter gelidistatuariae]